MIKFKVNGVERQRAGHGETIVRIVRALSDSPWQTTRELGTSHMTMGRMLRKGAVVRRASARKFNAWEYALPGAAP